MAIIKRKEARRKPRHPFRAKVRLHWYDEDGVLKSAIAVSQDISRTGMQLTLDKPIPAHTLVNLQCTQLHVVGLAIVRHCRRSDVNNYSAGFEFAGGTEWRQGE